MAHDGFAKFKRRFLKGAVLYKEGDPADEVFFIQSGIVALRKNVEGRVIILALLEKGDFFGDVGVFEGNIRGEEAAILKEAEVVVIPQYEFERMIASNIEIAVRMIKKYCSRLTTVYNWIGEQLPKDEKGRVLTTLVSLMTRFGVTREGKIHITVPLTNNDIAGLAGAQLLLTDRIMDDLSAGGMIATVEDHLVVLNKEKFNKFIEYYRWRKNIQS